MATAVQPTPTAPAPAPAPSLEKLAFPESFSKLKERLVPDPEKIIPAWNEILAELATVTERFNTTKQENIPIIEFSELKTLSNEKRNQIKRAGCVIIRNVVDDTKALEWKKQLAEYVRLNPSVGGRPPHRKQLYMIYWARSLLQARAHPNVLATSTFLNELYHTSQSKPPSLLEPSTLVDLSTPLTYADRFRIREPIREPWGEHPPHIDGPAIERWDDDTLREGCYQTILNGNWRAHDPYDMSGRLAATTNKYGRPNQSSVFRTFQGWLSMSNTGPGEGTLRLFPDILISNSYLLLRPFFEPVKPFSEFLSPSSSSSSTSAAGGSHSLTVEEKEKEKARQAFLSPSNWRFSTASPEFPGITPILTEIYEPSSTSSTTTTNSTNSKPPTLERKEKMVFTGQRLTEDSHPHLRLDLQDSMVSIPRVQPGDMVFWHCDGIHAVEDVHTGLEDSSVIYIPSLPLTLQNITYTVLQRTHFHLGRPGPDFPQDPPNEYEFVDKGVPEDVGEGVDGRRAMGLGDVGFDVDVDEEGKEGQGKGLSEGVRRLRELANEIVWGREGGKA